MTPSSTEAVEANYVEGSDFVFVGSDPWSFIEGLTPVPLLNMFHLWNFVQFDN